MSFFFNVDASTEISSFFFNILLEEFLLLPKEYSKVPKNTNKPPMAIPIWKSLSNNQTEITNEVNFRKFNTKFKVNAVAIEFNLCTPPTQKYLRKLLTLISDY